MRGWRRWTTPGALLVGVALVLLLTVLTRRVGDPDFWWHLRIAQWMVDNHSLPSHDIFTYTVPTNPWVDHEYGTELIMYGLYRLGGFALVSVVFALVTWAGFLLIVRRIQLERVPAVIIAIVLGLAALAGAAVWGPRSQMITFALTCLELFWLEAFLRDRSRALYALPAVVVVWANLHAGFVFSLLFVGVALGCELLLWWSRRSDEHRRRAARLVAVLVLCAVAGLITPHGLDLYRYVVRTQLSAVQQSFIAEWHSPDFHRLDTRGLELMILLLLGGFALRPPRLWDVALTMVATVFALQAVRHTAIFVAAVTPVVAWSYAGVWDRVGLVPRLRAFIRTHLDEVRVAFAGVLAATLVFTALFARTTLHTQGASTAANFPVEAVKWLRDHPQTGTHMFNAYDWGGYLAYSLYPDPKRRVFSFGEAVVMGDPLMQQVSDVENSKPDWLAILEQHQVDYVVERPDSPLAMTLSFSPGWVRVCCDDNDFSVIFVRQP
jgi:hypothetical protein